MTLKKVQKGLISVLAVAAIDLHGVYDLARENSETLKIQKQSIYQSEETIKQARGALMPSLDYSYRWLQQDVPEVSSSLSSLRQETQSTSQITLTQPLFRGMAEYAGLEISNIRNKFEEKAYFTEELRLFEEVAELFYIYFSNSADIRNLNELLDNLNSRVKELNRRAKIGRSDRTDLLSAKSQAALAESELILARDRLRSSMESLQMRVPSLEFGSLHDTLKLPDVVPPLKSFMDRIDQRPDLQQALLQTRSADEQIRVARSGHFPNLSVEGNYYFIRPGVLQDVEWDVGLFLSFPLFEGGRVNSEVRQAASVKTQQELALARLREQAEVEVKSAYGHFMAQQQRLKILNSTVKLSRDNYQSQKRNYSRGLKSYLEVIQIEREYWDVQRTLDSTIFETKLAWIRLKRSVGERP